MLMDKVILVASEINYTLVPNFWEITLNWPFEVMN